MFTDTYRLISLEIAEGHREIELERSFRRGRSMMTQAVARRTEPREAIQVAVATTAVTAPDAALIAAGERSDALLTPACGPCETADRAA